MLVMAVSTLMRELMVPCSAACRACFEPSPYFSTALV